MKLMPRTVYNSLGAILESLVEADLPKDRLAEMLRDQMLAFFQCPPAAFDIPVDQIEVRYSLK